MQGELAPRGAYDAELTYTRPANVGPDDARAGLLRARTLSDPEREDWRSFDLRSCRIRDLDAPETLAPDLVRHGFDHVDLSPFAELQRTLERVCAAGHVTKADASAIRRGLTGEWLRLSDGSFLRILLVAPEGLIMRKAGPNRVSVVDEELGAMNGHDAALSVHADQDVGGTPLRQMMRGAAPWLFRHDSPGARNRWSPLMLLNLWIPLQQITRPLALMDKRTLDRSAHQLRYGLATDAFLDRDEERRVNDIWTFLHDEGQRWYFSSEMDSRRGYVFETLGTPHASFVVPGEDVAESGYRALGRAAEAVRGADAAALRDAAAGAADLPSPAATTPALRRAIEAMGRLLEEARDDPASFCRGAGRADWLARASAARERVVRKSIEMRIIALRIPRPWARKA